MKRYAKLAVRLLTAAGIMAATFAMTSWADDEDREKITSIKLNFSFDTYDREVTVDGEGDFYVDDYDVTTSGNTPKVKVYLEADDGYYFSSKSSSIFKLSGEGAKLSGTPSIVNDKTEMRVTVQLNDIDGWNDIDEAYWENDDTAIAHWTDTGSTRYGSTATAPPRPPRSPYTTTSTTLTDTSMRAEDTPSRCAWMTATAGTLRTRCTWNPGRFPISRTSPTTRFPSTIPAPTAAAPVSGSSREISGGTATQTVPTPPATGSRSTANGISLIPAAG